MRDVDADELVAVVAERFDAHPWARLCRSPRLPWERGWDAGDAVVWRSGHPWTTRPEWHALGRPAAVHAALATATGRGPVTDLVAPASYQEGFSLGLTGRGAWSLRLRYAAGTVLPGEDRVGWLADTADTADTDDTAEIAAFLAEAMPHAEVQPGDPRGGRWFGVRDDDGTVLAAAVETLLAPVPHLSSLAVRPSARRRGLGAAVTSWFVRESIAGGAPEVVLGVDGDNATGQATYDALGFDRWDMSGWGAA